MFPTSTGPPTLLELAHTFTNSYALALTLSLSSVPPCSDATVHGLRPWDLNLNIDQHLHPAPPPPPTCFSSAHLYRILNNPHNGINRQLVLSSIALGLETTLGKIPQLAPGHHRQRVRTIRTARQQGKNNWQRSVQWKPKRPNV